MDRDLDSTYGGAHAPEPVHGRSPRALATRRLVRNRPAITALVVFALLVLSCLAAPLYAADVAHTDPFVSNPAGMVVLDGKRVELLQSNRQGLGETPIGPTWQGKYFLGSDVEGRDVMARLLYGGRSSLLIGISSALMCSGMALVIALFAGFYGGVVDNLLSRLLEVIWAFPVFLVAISLATVLQTNGLRIGFLSINSGSLWLPTIIIAVVYVPYVARPIRGQVLSVREKDFVEAAISQGAGNARLVCSEILPNVMTVVIVLFPLVVATNILTESALSYLGIGVQPPQASWGTIIATGQDLLYTRPWISIAGGVAIVITVLALNVLGDGVRDAVDPKAKLRIDG